MRSFFRDWWSVPGLLLACLCAVAAGADIPWQAQGWSHRALVKVDQAGAAGVDVAAVTILHQGLAQASGYDYRIFDAAGKPVPYQLTLHHPQRQSLLSFRAGKPGETFAVYFGKADAQVDPLRAVVDERPGAGPPQPGPAAQGWIPKAGLVMQTLRRPHQADNPQTPEEMAKLIAQSPAIDGGDYRANIRDGLNLYGDTDYFISIYRGWIQLPQAGNWSFCTASNEASFSFIDGRELVHWPGRHTEQRGKFGQKNASRQLAAGLHYLEYYHENMLLYSTAFLGWKPPGAPHYQGIPDAAFPQPHKAVVLRYQQSPGRAVTMIRPTLLDSLWSRERATGQYTRYRLIADAGQETINLDDWDIQWDFGDGQSARGAAVQHVFLTPGDYQVRCRVQAPDGRKWDRLWPLTVFPIDHQGGGFVNGKIADYLPIVSEYDHATLPTMQLAELGHLWHDANGRNGGEIKRAQQIAELVAKRSDLSGAAKISALLLAAGDAGLPMTLWQPGASPQEWRQRQQYLQEALDLTTVPAQRIALVARLIRHQGVGQHHLEAALKLYQQLEPVVKEHGLEGAMRQAYLQATVALGDARLAAGKLEQAGDDYRTAEALVEPATPMPVRVSKIGAYPETIEQHLRSKRYRDAQEIIRRWLEEFPSERLRGTVHFWLGKVYWTQNKPREAVKPLDWAVQMGEGSDYEAEARWLLAQAKLKSGDQEGGILALRALVASNLASPFREQAIQELQKSSPRK